MKFCIECGERTEFTVVWDDARKRYVARCIVHNDEEALKG